MTFGEPFAFRSPNVILFGCGEARKVGAQAARYGRRALIVTGRASARSAGHLDLVEESLRAARLDLAVFEGVRAEPHLSDVEHVRRAIDDEAADVVVCLGGGSAIDVGKAAAALARTGTPAAEYHSGGLSCDEPGLPCIALPTTAGTGAEATPNSVIIDPDTRVKASMRGEALLPAVAIVDPDLTLSLPPEPTVYSGLDAFCQAVESYVSRGANPMSDSVALMACELTALALPRAFDDGSDTEARARMALGSMLAGLALASARLGLVHGLAHPIGVATGAPHGLVCGAMLPMAIRANAAEAAPKYARIARAISGAEAPAAPPSPRPPLRRAQGRAPHSPWRGAGGEGRTDSAPPPKLAPMGAGGGGAGGWYVEDTTEDDFADTLDLADWVEALCHSVGVPTRLSELGVRDTDIPELARLGAKAGSTAYNPRAMTAAEIEDLLRNNL